MVLKLEPFPVNDNHYFGCITVEQNHHYCHNTNSTQPKVGIDNTTHPPTIHRKLNVSNISAVTYSIWMKL